MKKICLFLLSLATIFTLAACSEDTTEATKAGVFANETAESTVGAMFDAKEYVTVKDADGNEVTEGFETFMLIDDSGVPVSSEGRLTTTGTFPITYKGKYLNVDFSLLVRLTVTEAVNNSEWVNNGIAVSSVGSTVVFDYGIPGTSWWDLHAILPITNHPSDHNTMTAVVNGPANHEFILKVESSTGAETEVKFTTSGLEQTITLCVEPKFTSEDIAGIYQVILFNVAASTAGTLNMTSFGFSNEEIPTFEPTWSFYGGAYQDAQGDIVFPVCSSNFWDIGALYSQNGYPGAEALRVKIKVELGHSVLVKFETSTGSSHETTVVGTGQLETIDIIPGFDEAGFRTVSKLALFWLDKDKGETSTITMDSIEGITLDDVAYNGDVNVEFLNAGELIVQLSGNTVNAASLENFTITGSIEGFEQFNINQFFWHGAGFIQATIGFGGTVTGGDYNVEVIVSYKGEVVGTYNKVATFVDSNTGGGDTDEDGDTTLPSIPDSYEIPEGMTGGTLNTIQPVEVYSNQHMKFAIEIPGLTKAEAEKLAVGFFSEDYPNAEIRVIGQVGDTGIHLEVNLGTAFPEGYGNDDFGLFEFEVVFFDANGDVVGYYNQ